MTNYTHLLSPGRIGSLELPNRIIMTPMGEELGNADGTVSDVQQSYLEARAKGGVAVVMLGSVGVAWPEGCSNKYQTAISTDAHLPGWRAAAERVHRHGGRIAIQLTHAGKNGLQDVMAGRPMWVPSPPHATPHSNAGDPLYGMVTPDEGAAMMEAYSAPTSAVGFRVMDHDDIATVVEQFAAATARAREAGVDAVELHAGHGYLIDEFLSPAVNHRDDEYGGSVQNRARFMVEILTEIRRRVGDDYPVWVRLNSTEVFIDGITIDDAVVNARLAQDAGADAVHMSAYHDPDVAVGPTSAYIPHQPELLVDFARRVNEEVTIPVIGVGRISPERADILIGEGAFDFVAMGRKLLADPELPAKLAAGNDDEVRPCVYHYRCIGNIYVRKGARCVANGELGRSDELTATPLPVARKVLVVGGGPAGMEAARMARRRGHDVTLVEAADSLGGRWRYAAATDGPNNELLAWLERQMEALEVDVRLSTVADPSVVSTLGPEVVVVATGARWGLPEVPGATLDHVRRVDQLGPWLLDEGPLEAERVVVLGGDVPGLALANTARAQGAHVSVLEETNVFATALGLPGRWRMVHDLGERGVTLMGTAEVVAITDEGVVYRHDGEEHTQAADLVLVTSVVSPDTTLATTLAGALASEGVPVHAIGDGASVGYLEAAMRTAVETAVSL